MTATLRQEIRPMLTALGIDTVCSVSVTVVGAAPAAFLTALVTTRRALASWYTDIFQVPRLPERFVLGRQGGHSRAAEGAGSPSGHRRLCVVYRQADGPSRRSARSR